MIEERLQTMGKVYSQRKKSKTAKGKTKGRAGAVGERGIRKGPEMQSTLASFTEQATLTHREGDYSKGKVG